MTYHVLTTPQVRLWAERLRGNLSSIFDVGLSDLFKMDHTQIESSTEKKQDSSRRGCVAEGRPGGPAPHRWRRGGGRATGGGPGRHFPGLRT